MVVLSNFCKYPPESCWGMVYFLECDESFSCFWFRRQLLEKPVISWLSLYFVPRSPVIRSIDVGNDQRSNSSSNSRCRRSTSPHDGRLTSVPSQSGHPNTQSSIHSAANALWQRRIETLMRARVVSCSNRENSWVSCWKKLASSATVV